MEKFLNNANQLTIFTIGTLLICFVATIDFITTYEISISIFYLIPIALITWYSGKTSGIIFSVISAVIWFAVEAGTGREYSDPKIPYWNSLVRFGFFFVVTMLLSKLKEFNVILENAVQERTAELEAEITGHKKAKEEIERNSFLLRELNKKVETIKEEQNTRIAREIHDELGQSLTAINLELMWISKKHSNDVDIVNRMSMLSEIVSNTIGTVRRISSDLRPRLLDQLGLIPALESQLKEFSKRSGIPSELIVQEKKFILNSSISISVYRIIQEALTNISRHSDAENVTIIIKQDDRKNLLFSVKDDGKGFDVNKSIESSSSLGLISMKERAAIIEADLEIISSYNSGTEINLKIPIKNEYD